MKTAFITMASVAALALTASPAAAQTEGFRAEVHGGWDRVSNTGIEEDGILYGVGIGYDVRLGETAFVGVEANADLSNGDVCEADVFDDGDEACIAVRRDFSVGVRAGVNVAPNTAVYALAGYTNARFRLDYTEEGEDMVRTSANLDGLRVGAGVQQSFGNGAYAKVEYRYSNYEADTSRHNVLLGLGFQF
jgi:outer membrane immunogenic protein